jgi:hypothetical protein
LRIFRTSAGDRRRGGSDGNQDRSERTRRHHLSRITRHRSDGVPSGAWLACVGPPGGKLAWAPTPIGERICGRLVRPRTGPAQSCSSGKEHRPWTLLLRAACDSERLPRPSARAAG